MKRQRLDQVLTDRGWVASRTDAQRRILAGDVRVDGQQVRKASQSISADANVELSGAAPKYVSRGGFKLEKALSEFCIDVSGKTFLDAGASTGGFTDCLLQHGAAMVYALDVGYGQLAWKLREDPRVRVMERTNIRHANLSMFDPPVDAATADLAFIGLTKVLPVLANLLPVGSELVALIKPHFEAGPKLVEKGGVVRRPEVHVDVLQAVYDCAAQSSLAPVGIAYSPVRGRGGNIEYLGYFRRGSEGEPLPPEAFERVVFEAHAAPELSASDEKEQE
ncbi:TlyA family RNA methyltransferase [Candidatus Poribacteria bacterium]|nr:TlyA family RNA methyltransferase [Candidatus Poribacteria bacterium]